MKIIVWILFLTALAPSFNLANAAETNLGGIATLTTNNRWVVKEVSSQEEGHYVLTIADSEKTGRISGYIELARTKQITETKDIREWVEKFQIPNFRKGYIGNFPSSTLTKESSIALAAGIPATLILQEIIINGNKRFVAFVFWQNKIKDDDIFGYVRISNLGDTTILSPDSGPLKDLLDGIKLSN